MRAAARYSSARPLQLRTAWQVLGSFNRTNPIYVDLKDEMTEEEKKQEKADAKGVESQKQQQVLRW